MQRSLNDAEKSELAALTADVAGAIARRRDWLDAKMFECSTIKPGDDLYNLDTGARIGVVTKLLRYWRLRDEGVRDTSHHCDYEFKTNLGTDDSTYYDNTARGLGFPFGDKEQARTAMERRAKSLA